MAAVWIGAVAPFRPELISPENLGELAVSTMPLLVLAVGQLIVLLVGGIDLSAAAVVGLASVLGAKAMAAVPNPAVGLAAMLAVGLAVGAFHGAAVAGLRMPAFLVTMATLTALSGAALWVMESRPLTDLPEPFLKLLGGTNGVWVAAGVCVVAHLLLAHTIFGRHLIAVGLNPAAARVSGVPVGWRVAAAFAASGLCSGIAAALYAARLEAGSATLVPKEILLDVLGAAVIGGASLRGGRGSVIGVAVGVAVIALIGNSLTLLDLDYWHVVMAKGGLIFLAAGLDVLRTRGQT